ncbi:MULTISPECIES: hypothetical protein [Bacillus]|uniref:hypothetical protein n=1 Tax=Bacillus TaxID=1386 RepID=UPI0011A247A9|nr:MULTISPECIES: hypothetical protein [Bacillus]MDX9635990.1 hypothetical protein [Bacillus sp. PBL-C9]
MKPKQLVFYGKIQAYYELDSIEDAVRLYNSYNQLKKMEAPNKVEAIEKMLTRLYEDAKLVP